jgi:hypothetical protein
MDPVDKMFVAVIACTALIFALFLSYFAFRDHTRATYLDRSADPIAAACAFDSGGKTIAPSCMAYMLQQKENIR